MDASINDKLKKYKSLFSTTLSTGIGTGTSDTLTPATVTGLPTDTAITLTIDRVDASGTATPSKMERIKGVVSSGNIINYVRAVDGTTEQAHTAGAVVEMVWNADDWNNAVDHLLVEHGQDGKHTKVNGNTVTAGTDTVALLTASQTLTNKTLSTGSKLDANADSNFTFNSLSRQAIINGNFDVWQRGTTLTNMPTGTFLADRWQLGYVNTGTLPTNIVSSRQLLTSGDIPNAFYHYRIAPDGAGSGFGADDLYHLVYRVEHGTRYLCGDGKKITLSFYARSSIANKKLGLHAIQKYGTGGSPTALEIINGTHFDLTSTWTKYTYTITTNTLASKTFGTANDDSIELRFGIMWGTNIAARYNDGTTAETFVGSGNIDIAQVQLCAGDVALPFMPKSYEEELRACQRYCVVLNGGDQGSFSPAFGTAATTTIALCYLSLGVEMRTNPTLTATATEWVLTDGANTSIDLTDISIQSATNSVTSPMIRCTVASGLTQYRPYFLAADVNLNRKMIFSAEL